MSSDGITIELPDDPAATERVGEWIGSRLRPGDTLALCGPLGAGKTTFVRGLARGLEVDDPEAVSSPTYLLVIEHDGPVPFLHADAYLPAKLAAFLEDGGLEYLFDPAKVVAVEWADQIRKQLPGQTLWITLGLSARPGRRLELQPAEGAAFPWLTELPTICDRQ